MKTCAELAGGITDSIKREGRGWGVETEKNKNKKKNNFKSVEQREPVCLHRHHLLRIFLRQKSVRLTEETACNSKTRLSPRIKAQTFPRVLLPGIAHS